jgi:hypothetical protein
VMKSWFPKADTDTRNGSRRSWCVREQSRFLDCTGRLPSPRPIEPYSAIQPEFRGYRLSFTLMFRLCRQAHVAIEVSRAERPWVMQMTLLIALAMRGDGFAAETATNPVAHKLSREEAVQMLQQRYGSAARVVRSEVVEDGRRRVYVFRLLSVDDRVWTVRIDGKSGIEVP